MTSCLESHVDCYHNNDINTDQQANNRKKEKKDTCYNEDDQHRNDTASSDIKREINTNTMRKKNAVLIWATYYGKEIGVVIVCILAMMVYIYIQMKMIEADERVKIKQEENIRFGIENDKNKLVRYSKKSGEEIK